MRLKLNGYVPMSHAMDQENSKSVQQFSSQQVHRQMDRHKHKNTALLPPLLGIDIDIQISKSTCSK